MKQSPLKQSNPDFNNKIYYDESLEQDMSEKDVENLDEDRNSNFTQQKSNDMKFNIDFAKLQAINKTKPVMIGEPEGDGAQDIPGVTYSRTPKPNKNPLKLITPSSPFEMSCWKGYKAKGKKKSPSGKKTKSGKIKMVNNCVKK
tara:strand:- start:39 stop:470 length:432 start_codon:yes stop_codon:yes gene_type:complete